MGNGKDFKAEMVSRANAAIDVYNALQDGTESFEEGNLGACLAYLMGALLKGEKFEAWLGVHDDFVALLHEHVPSDHPAWGAIDFMTETVAGTTSDTSPLPDHIKEKLLAGIGPGNLDEEDYPDLSAWHDVLRGESQRGPAPDEVGEDGLPR